MLLYLLARLDLVLGQLVVIPGRSISSSQPQSAQGSIPCRRIRPALQNSHSAVDFLSSGPNFLTYARLELTYVFQNTHLSAQLLHSP
ncbi:unnamed protein product [Gadus morhua 'NCC']